jgi:hypothetical protein
LSDVWDTAYSDDGDPVSAILQLAAPLLEDLMGRKRARRLNLTLPPADLAAKVQGLRMHARLALREAERTVVNALSNGEERNWVMNGLKGRRAAYFSQLVQSVYLTHRGYVAATGSPAIHADLLAWLESLEPVRTLDPDEVRATEDSAWEEHFSAQLLFARQLGNLDQFIALLKKAAQDPRAQAVWQTAYRISLTEPVMHAAPFDLLLETAADALPIFVREHLLSLGRHRLLDRFRRGSLIVTTAQERDWLIAHVSAGFPTEPSLKDELQDAINEAYLKLLGDGRMEWAALLQPNLNRSCFPADRENQAGMSGNRKILERFAEGGFSTPEALEQLRDQVLNEGGFQRAEVERALISHYAYHQWGQYGNRAWALDVYHFLRSSFPNIVIPDERPLFIEGKNVGSLILHNESVPRALCEVILDRLGPRATLGMALLEIRYVAVDYARQSAAGSEAEAKPKLPPELMAIPAEQLERYLKRLELQLRSYLR